ncbi:ATP-binding cassette domain-containing protein [bacterium]|nr:ATP-binding cassette domain-containing protein [bacterium]
MASTASGATESRTPLLSIKNLCIRFGGVLALDNVNLDISPGRIVGLIGPNGAGKTTMFNCISRLYQPTSGRIEFAGEDLTTSTPQRIARLGIGRTFQNVASFDELSVLDNVRIGAHTRSTGNIVSDMLSLPNARRQERSIDETAYKFIDYLGLADVAHSTISSLSLGTRKRVEIARALAMSPRLLMLDEPAGGLTHSEVAELGRLFVKIRDDWQITILLVEHHMQLVMSVSDEVTVLNFGKNLAHGTPSQIRSNPDVIHAYLGRS